MICEYCGDRWSLNASNTCPSCGRDADGYATMATLRWALRSKDPRECLNALCDFDFTAYMED